MTFTVRLQRKDAMFRMESFETFQEAQAFAAQQHSRDAIDLAIITEVDEDGKEVRTHRIDHFHT